MSFSDDCLRKDDLFEEFSDSLKYSDHLKESTTTTETLKTLENAEKGDNDSVYEKLHLLPNLAVIGVLFRWFYGYLLILGIFPFFGGVCR